VITGDLDEELARSLAALAADGELPGIASQFAPGGTWRPAPGGDPARYATSLAFELARLDGRSPASLAAVLAESLRAVAWIEGAEPAGDGYLTITVTPQALASSAARMAVAGSACTNSTILRGTVATVRPWPDLAAAPSWQRAWQEQADTMTGRLAQAAGATVTITSEWERGGHAANAARQAHSPVRAAVAYLGASSVRYRLARTLPGTVAQLEQLSQGSTRQADPLYQVQQAHADAASTLRWAGELQLESCDPGERLAELLGSPDERALLGLLSWLPVRVASAARRHRPDELPRYLEQVGAAWQACRQASPALPFGGQAAAGNPAVASARLLLADAVRAALAAGLALTGITASDRL
jgi:arginyl-tRNA synthetase